MNTASAFRDKLSEVLAGKGVSVDRWVDTRRVSDNLLQIETPGKATVLYVKASNNK